MLARQNAPQLNRKEEYPMKYTKPEAEITYFETADVVETSGTTTTGGESPAVSETAVSETVVSDNP